MVSISMMFFVFSTVVVVIFYGSRMAEFLFGLTAGWVMKTIYVLSMIVGALGAAQQL